MSKHSPLPWTLEINEYGSTRIVDGNHDMLYGDKDNGGFIVEACNNYEQLLQENEELKRRVKELESKDARIQELEEALKELAASGIGTSEILKMDYRKEFPCITKALQLLGLFS